MSRDRLERNQIWVYAAGLLLGAALGLTLPGMGSASEALIYPVLGILLYVTFLQVPFRELRRSFTHGRYMAAVLALNFLVIRPWRGCLRVSRPRSRPSSSASTWCCSPPASTT